MNKKKKLKKEKKKPFPFLLKYFKKPALQADIVNYNLVEYEKIEKLFSSQVSDYKYCEKIEKKILKKLKSLLNQIHNVNYSERFWRIVLGHWLQKLIYNIYSKYKYYEEFHKTLMDSHLFETKIQNFNIRDTRDFLFITNNLNWNKKIFFQIAQFKKKKLYKKISIKKSKKIFQIKYINFKENSLFKESIKNCINVINSIFCKKDTPVILGTCLGLKDDISLKLKYFFLPSYLPIKKIIYKKQIAKVRSNIKKNISYTSKDDFEKFVLEIINENIPSVFLENFKSNLDRVKKETIYPNKPKFIFTSNNFETDEFFKLYTAIKVENGSKYFVGQHGNVYGTEISSQYYTEYKTCDYFLTWGWKNERKDLPAYIFGEKKINISPSNNGKILFLVEPLCHEDRIDIKINQQINSLKKNINLINSLPKHIKKNIFIRIYPDQVKLNFKKFCIKNNLMFLDTELILKRNIKNLNFDKRDNSLQNIMCDYSLVLHNYDGTGFNETIYSNFPSSSIWYENFNKYNSKARKKYYQLKLNKVIHSTNKSLKFFLINNEKDNYKSWWNSNKVQGSIDSYNELFNKSKTNSKTIYDIIESKCQK